MSFFHLNKKVSSILIWVFIPVFFYSCKKGPCYRYEITELSLDSVPSELLELTPLNLDMVDVDAFYCIDSLIITHKGSGYSNYPYTVYNSVTLDSILSFGIVGRARNEFLSNAVNPSKQYYKRGGHYIIPLMDNDVCKELNLNKTLEKKFMVIDRFSEGINFLQGTSVLYGEDYDKTFTFVKGRGDELYSDEQTLPQIIYTDERGKTDALSVYRRFPHNNTDMNAAAFLSGVLFKQPEGNIVAQPLNQMSYILYYDIENKTYHAVHLEGTRTFEDGIPENEEEQHIMTFQDDAAFSKDYLFVIYMGDYRQKKKEDPDYMGRIIQLDWNGNLIKSYVLHEWINRITYDETNHILYGSNYWFGNLYSCGVIE